MRLYTQLDRWSLRAADRSVTMCEPFADLLVARGVRRDRIQVVPNAMAAAPVVAEEDVKALRDRLAFLRPRASFFRSGAYQLKRDMPICSPRYGFCCVTTLQLTIRLILVGDGIERPALERAAAAPDLASSVIFAGHCSNVWPYYSLADVFALPSHSEGSPNALLEAMAAGVPIVACKVGGVPETVEDGRARCWSRRRNLPRWRTHWLGSWKIPHWPRAGVECFGALSAAFLARIALPSVAPSLPGR